MTVIDTCSLLNLVQYYLPFDKDSILLTFIKEEIEKEKIIVIDQVVKQCGWTSKGLVLNEIPFLKDHQTKTTNYLPDKRFFHWLNNDFKVNDLCKKLKPEEFEIVKTEFINDADVKMLLFCNNHRTGNSPARLLTDESGKNNDSKYFKKLPLLCDTMGIQCINLPTFLKEHDLVHIMHGFML